MPRGKGSCRLGERGGAPFRQTGGQAPPGWSFWEPPSLGVKAVSLVKTGSGFSGQLRQEPAREQRVWPQSHDRAGSRGSRGLERFTEALGEEGAPFIGCPWPHPGAEMNEDSQGRELCVGDLSTFRETVTRERRHLEGRGDREKRETHRPSQPCWPPRCQAGSHLEAVPSPAQGPVG